MKSLRFVYWGRSLLLLLFWASNLGWQLFPSRTSTRHSTLSGLLNFAQESAVDLGEGRALLANETWCFSLADSKSFLSCLLSTIYNMQ